MKLSTNYTAVKSISKKEFETSAESNYAVGNVTYPKQEVSLFLGKHNTDANKGALVYVKFKGKPTFIIAVGKLPESLLIQNGDTVSVVEKAVIGINSGNIVI